MGRPRKHTGSRLHRDPDSGIFYIVWYDPSRGRDRRKTTHTRDPEEAERKKAIFVLENARPSNAEPEEVSLTVILNRYYDDYACKLPSEEAAFIAIRRFNERWGAERVSHLRTNESSGHDPVRDYVDDRRAAGINDSTISRELSVLRAAVNRAWKKGMLKSVPFIADPKAYERPADEEPGEDEDDLHVLTLSQIAELFNALDPRSHVFDYFLAAGTTLQRTETVLQLPLERCDFENRIIRCNPAGRRQTTKFRPTIGMSMTFWWRFHAVKRKHLVEWAGKPLASIKTAVRKVRSDLDLPRWFTAKSLRGSIGTYLEHEPYRVEHRHIQITMGHRFPEEAGGQRRKSVTDRHYTKHLPDPNGPVPRAIDAFFAELQKKVDRPISPEFHPSDPQVIPISWPKSLKDGGRGWD